MKQRTATLDLILGLFLALLFGVMAAEFTKNGFQFCTCDCSCSRMGADR